MAGGNLQLILASNESSDVTQPTELGKKGDPKLCFFKAVVRKYHNFAKEPFVLQFDYVNIQEDKSTTITCTVPHYSPIVQNFLMVMKFPVLTTFEDIHPKWCEPLGLKVLEKIEFLIGSHTIETLTGEWLYWYYMTCVSEDEKNAFFNMVTSKFENTTTRIVRIPIPFWFSRNKKEIFPIHNLEYDMVVIRVTFRPLKDCYVVSKINESVNI